MGAARKITLIVMSSLIATLFAAMDFYSAARGQYLDAEEISVEAVNVLDITTAAGG